MKIKFTVKTVCAALAAGASSFAATYSMVSTSGVTAGEWAAIAWATLTAILAALTHDPDVPVVK